ncbi:MAG: winged helix-turn-helix domain-containing protein [Bryobacteraceae bacterium]|jgi:TolB-like protein/DNA-binding winged helix-turn-helix (wHTH) protein/Tfp pilus assembly protein PilF
MAGDSPTIRFGVFELDLHTRELRKAGGKVRIQEQPLCVLVSLLERPGELVTRDELRQKVWQSDTFVDFDTALNKAITKLRDVLGDSAASPRFVETLPKRGYRFIAPVEKLAPERGAPGPAAPEAIPPDTGHGWAKLAGAALAVLLLLAGIAWLRWSRESAPARIRSIAVLPLDNLSGDSNQEYFADGMTDELITDLAQIHTLRVISRTSVMQLKHTKKNLPQIAAELNVDAVVEGSVVRSGIHVRVTAQLLDARQDRHLWAASYERDMTDIIGLQGQVAKAIADQVKVKLTPEEDARLAKRQPANPEAYDALLKGRFLWNKRNAAAAEKAIDYFREATGKDPGNAEAWAALAGCYASLGSDIGSIDPAKAAPEARAAVAKALELDPHLAEAHGTLAKIKLWYDWDWTGAEREFRRAIELNPNDSRNHMGYSQYLQVRKRFAEALEENRRAIDLAPLDILGSMHLAWLYFDAREADKTLAQSKRVLEMDPAFTGAYLFVARGYELQGKWPEAIAAYEQARDAYREPYLAGVAHAWAASGNGPQAEAALAKLREFSRQHYVRPLAFAGYYAALGDRDRAFEWLERGYRQRAPGLIELEVSYVWDNLRTDQRFHSLERRVGF